MTVRGQLLLFLGLLGIGFGVGCRGELQPVAAEIDEVDYRKGQQQLKQGRPQEALASFMKVIEKRGVQASPESHLEAGVIFLKHSKDPVEAYHYFRKYLAQQPNSAQAPHVRGLLGTALREFASTLPGQPLENQAPRMDLLDQMTKLQREIEELRAENAALRYGAGAGVQKTVRAPLNGESPAVRPSIPAPLAATPVEDESPITAAPAPSRGVTASQPQSPPQPPVPASPSTTIRTIPPGGRAPPLRPGAAATLSTPTGRRHVVAQKETLFGLSKKYYGAGSTAKAKAIYEANRDVMKNEGDLRPGMELRIP